MLTNAALLILVSVFPARGAPGTPSGEVRYGRDIRAILSDRCFVCHGADAGSREAGLRLDNRAGATADLGGYAAIVPGELAQSELWARITSEDEDYVMPPPHAKKRTLSADEEDLIARWIEEGAAYEEHWAFVAPTRPALPEVADGEWPRGAIDAFVLARMEAAGLAPSPEADRATLLRRVFLDLTGLPPTLEELDAFLADEAPDAYERVVQRLFEEEPYRSRLAERLATPWLDAARYADTCGIHMDAGRQAWHWRDWLLEALRDNMPYDEFVIEQLAGDLLPDATTAQKVATGFHRNQVTTDEGGAIDEEYLVEYAVDRVNTTGAVFLGLTVGCARCHDHKYDPLTQADYYSLISFFNSVDQPGLYTQSQDTNRAYQPAIEVPTEEQQQQLAALDARLAELDAAMRAPLPGEERARAEFTDAVTVEGGLDWTTPRVTSAASSDPGVSFAIGEDGVLVARGPMPAREDYTLELASDAAGSRLLLLEALSIGEDHPGPGRASHGNAVLTHVTLEQRAAGSEADWSPVPLRWAWSDHSQTGGDFVATNVLEDDARGWTVAGNGNPDARTLLLLADEEFGSADGAELRVVLAFQSRYEFHSLGRLRLRVSPLASEARLPVGYGRWHKVAAFRPAKDEAPGVVYDRAYGPESVASLDLAQTFGDDQRPWTFEDRLRDELVVKLADGVSANFVGRTLWSPEARELEVSLGSDDGILAYLNGELILDKRVNRGAAPDQERATLPLRAGRNTLILRIVNTGGPSGYYFRALPAEQVLAGELPSLLLPEEAVSASQAAKLTRRWRRRFFDDYRALDDEAAAKRAERTALAAAIPLAMVMKETETPRETFVLMRGQYDAPDRERPVGRETPGFLPPLPEGASRDRLGLAQWLVSAEHPLFARVAVNRFWQEIFGRGIVSTPQDFGLQGAWPTHPQLLDWLAVEFRESGWDVRALLESFVLSSTYRQSSRVRPEVAELDPGGALLAAYPRRRLGAEEIRDLALYTSGLLVEQLGGRSVKTYQPEGLWKEVAMLASNTRLYQRGEGDDLWRRSLYTYWKRAVPPPSLLTFDAPTRESCVVRRQITNTPLQALVLWNDEQYVEAARALATRALAAREEDDERLVWTLRVVTGRTPEPDELRMLSDALADFRVSYAQDEARAVELTSLGEAPVPAQSDPAELAAWTMVASAVLNLHETLTQD